MKVELKRLDTITISVLLFAPAMQAHTELCKEQKGCAGTEWLVQNPGPRPERSSSCRCTRPSLSSGGFAQFPGVTSHGEIQDHCLGPVSAPVPVYTASIKPGIKKRSAQIISIRKSSCAEQHCQLCHLQIQNLSVGEFDGECGILAAPCEPPAVTCPQKLPWGHSCLCLVVSAGKQGCEMGSNV